MQGPSSSNPKLWKPEIRKLEKGPNTKHETQTKINPWF